MKYICFSDFDLSFETKLIYFQIDLTNNKLKTYIMFTEQATTKLASNAIF